MATQYGRAKIQSLLYESKIQDANFSITYLNGGVEGYEKVEVIGNDIFVTIENGRSSDTLIKEAIEAHPVASTLVSISIDESLPSGQYTVVEGELSGGQAAVYSTLNLDGVLYTAQTAGLNGNNIRISHALGTDNSSLACSTSGEDISVTLALSGSLVQDVIQIVKNDATASGLVDITTDGRSPNRITDYEISLTNMIGGLDALASSGIFDDVMISANTTGPGYNGTLITFTDGATSGAEVVVASSGNVSIQIENSVSTGTQIIDALNAESDFSDHYTAAIRGGGASGSGQYTVNEIAMSGFGYDANMQGLYQESDADGLISSSYVFRSFGFAANNLYIDNFGTTGNVCVSLDGTKDHIICEADTDNTTIESKLDNKPGVYLKYTVAAPTYNLRATR